MRYKKTCQPTAWLGIGIILVLSLAFIASLTPRSVSAATGITVGSSSLNLGAAENLFYGVMGTGSSGTGGGLLLQKPSGTNIFKIDSGGGGYFAGSVGIGTTNPTAKLYVNGNGLITQAFYVDAGAMTTTQTLFEHTGANTPVPFRIMKSGYSGAGTTYGILELTMNDNIVNNGSNLHFELKNSAGAFTEYAGLGGRIMANTASAERGQLFFYTMDDGVGRSPKMVIDPDGKVGIGVTNPGANLEVSGSSDVGLNVKTTATSNTGAWVKYIRSQTGLSSTWRTGTGINTNSNAFDIYEDAPSAGTRMTILSGGYVGIGVTNPAQKLQVKDGSILISGAVAAAPKLIIGDTTYGGGIIQSYANASYSNLNLQSNIYYDGSAWQYNKVDYGSWWNQLYTSGTKANDYVQWSYRDPNAIAGPGTNVLTLKADGSVGISKTNPSTTLDVVGGGNFTGTVNGTSLCIAGDCRASWAAAGNVWSGTRNGNIWNGDAGAGNVGIGTTNPTTVLSVKGSANNGINIQGVGTTAARGFLGLDASNHGKLNLVDASGNENVRLVTSGNSWVLGNVGIGTTNPQTPLHIINTTDAPIRLQTTSGGNLSTQITQYYTSWYGLTHPFIIQGVDGSGTSDMVFTPTVNTPTSGLVIKASGNIGIGTTNPGQKLEVNGSLSAIYGNKIGFRYSSSDANLYNYITVTGEGGVYPLTLVGGTMTGGDVAAIKFETQTAGSAKMTIMNGGNVGIGTVSPTRKLSVSAPAGYGSGIGLFTNLTGTEQEIFRVSNTGSGVNDAMLTLSENGVAKVLIGANNARSGNTYFNGGGYIGIAKTNPGTNLDITGGVNASGSINATSLCISSDCKTAWSQVSGNINWADLAGGKRTNYALGFQPPASGYAGFEWFGTNGSSAGYLLVRGTSDSDVYTAEGITLVADQGAITLAGRTTTNGNGFVRFMTPNSSGSSIERMRILATSGNVGIGTTGPTAKLHVVTAGQGPLDSFLFESTGGNAAVAIKGLSTSNYVYQTFYQGTVGKFEMGIVPTTSDFYINPNVQVGSAGAAIYVKKADGNVGIGTTNPGAMLHILNANATNDVDTNTLRVAGGTDGTLGSVNFNVWSHPSATAGNRYVRLQIQDNTGYRNLILNSDGGNVGIGTTAPGYKLQVYDGTARQAQFNGWSTDNNAESLNSGEILIGTPAFGTKIQFAPSTGGDNIRRTYIDNTYNTDATAQMVFRMRTAGTAVNAMTILGSGNVGIAKTNPGTNLDITGGVNASGSINATSLCIASDCKTSWSTLNADTVDSFHASSLMAARGTIAVASIDDATSPGFYQIVESGHSEGLLTFNPGGSVGIVQIYASYSGTLQWRNKTDSSSWTSWRTIWHSGNDGTGSGLDADLLDGYHYNGLPYLPLAGGTMSGAISMGANNITFTTGDITVDKLTVTTIDPLYNLKGTNYATYAASISGGVKEEYIGKIKLDRKNKLTREYEAVIDFANEEEGSDLWVWHQVVDFNQANVEVLITPYGQFAQAYYLISGDKLIFRSDRQVELSYRLIGKRFDWRKWPTKAEDQSQKGVEVK